MGLPELLHRSAEKQMTEFCRVRTEKDPFAGRVRFRMEEDLITVFMEGGEEIGNSPGEDIPVARLRFDSLLRQWTLHYPVEGRRWAFYLNAGPSLDLGKLLYHLDQDPLRLFWPDR